MSRMLVSRATRILALAAATLLAAACANQEIPPQGSNDILFAAVDAVYERAHADGDAYDPRGLCIADSLVGDGIENPFPGAGWAVDIVHVPRRPVDDVPANQCPRYLSGESPHLVEIDRDGEVVRVVR